jgi:N6-adenosine-specific RNA methylase IME4
VLTPTISGSRKTRCAEGGREAMSEVSQRYRTIVADPPWPIDGFPEWADGEGTIGVPYPTMTLEAIEALPVRELSDNHDGDAHLYLWTINSFLREAFDIASAWGFHHSSTLVWCKRMIGTGLGGAWPKNVEFALFCRRPSVVHRPKVLQVTTFLADAAHRAGVSRRMLDEHMGTSDMAGWWLSRIEYRCACPTNEQWPRLKAFLGCGNAVDELVKEINAAKGTRIAPPLRRAPSSWFQWPRGRHSAKPEAFIDLVEQVSPGPYLELFARRNRLGWDTWGNEALQHVTLEASK